MGLIRITGGIEGLAEYLERGEKKGRRHTRDQLDERVVLAGDLELTDSLIKSMATKGQRFLHITFSLKEDSVPLETLRGIVHDFEQFAFSAYGKHEYNFYAEAHLPRIKSLSDEFLGSDIIRLPHIHMIVPKINLLTGEGLNPFGLTARCIKEIDAFQELTNHTYGLASPKENRRNGFFERSEIVGGLSGTAFEGRGERLKFRILRAMLESEITSMQDFRALLKDFGQITIRNHGQEKEVASVRPEGSKKGVELLDQVFSPAFILLNCDEKKTFLIDQFGTKDFGEGDPSAKLDDALRGFRESIASNQEQRKELKKKICAAIIDRDIKTLEGFRKLLKDFGATRTRNAGRDNAYENVKPPGNVKGINLTDYEFSREFIELPLPQKKDHLAKQSAVKYEAAGDPREPPGELWDILNDWKKTRAREIKYINSGNRRLWKKYQETRLETREKILDGLEATFARRVESLRRVRQIGLTTIESIETERKIPRASSLPASNIAGDRERGGGRLKKEDLASTDSSPINPGRNDNHRLGQQGARHSSLARQVRQGTGRRSDSVVGQLARDLYEKNEIAVGAEDILIAEIKLRMDASALLNVLSKTRGLIIEKYSVTKWPKGGERIQCGNRNYTVNDFLTKEMHLSWKDAETLLRAEYSRQRRNRRERMPRRQPDRALWVEFQKANPVPSGDEREEQCESQRQSESRRWLAIADQYSREELKLASTGPIGVAKRNASLSLLRMLKIDHENELRRQIFIERQHLREIHRRSMKEYREWLTKLAEDDERALEELRRINVDLLERTGAKLSISGNPLRSPVIDSEEYEHSIDLNGDVTYYRHGVRAFRDTEKAVMMIETTDRDIEVALRLAILKFGQNLQLSGDQEFQFRVAEIAAEMNLPVEFDDPALNEIKQSRRGEITAEQTGRRKTNKSDGLGSSPRRSLVDLAGSANTVNQREELITSEEGGELSHPAAEQRADEIDAAEAETNQTDDDEFPRRPRI